MRNLTKTIAAVTLLAPASAYPLGIGDIKLHSALNQNLDAEIALLISANENVSNLRVRLAPPEKFDQAGVPWSYFLAKIKFESITKADGSTVVKVSSKEAMREPFLDFLLEVSWDKGNLYREFTVLIDPPTAYTQPVIPVVQKAKSIVEDKVAEVKKETPEAVETVAETVVPDGQYGPTNTTDNLWKIAEQTNVYDDVSLEQMMVAIYKANPKAFYKDNVNALMADVTLDIPEKEIIIRLSKKDALTEFKRQNDVWTGRVTNKIENQLATSEETKIKTQLVLNPPVEEIITDTVEVAGTDVSTESTIESKAEGVASQARLDELEQKLALKDKEIADLINQIKESKTQAEVESTVDATVAEMKAAEVKAEESKAAEVKAAEVKAEESKAAEVKAAEVKAAEAKVAEAKAAETKAAIAKDEEVKAAEAKAAAKVAEMKAAAIKAEEEKAAGTGFMSGTTLIIGGVSVAILGLLGFLFLRKRKNEEKNETDSMFATASEISLPDSDSSSSSSIEGLSASGENDTSSYDVGTVGESSFLSEFTPSDFDAFDTDQNEVDPISEADVYLAYGRYQQAEDLMRQAIVDQPERDECKLKLLEIFYSNENKDAYEKYASELVSSGKNNDFTFWEKVVEMGAELSPDSPLFVTDKAVYDTGDTDAESEEPVENIAENVDSTESIDDQTETEAVVNVESPNESGANEMDFDLSVFDQDDNEPEPEPEPEDNTDENSLEFDLSVFDEAESDNDVELDVNNEEMESVDFDLDTPNLDDELSTSSEHELNNDGVSESNEIGLDGELDSFDVSLDDLSSDLETSESEDIESATETENFDEFEFDVDTPSSPADSIEDIDLGVSDLTDMDELETKIDLAKAYIDMGDSEAAKGIAEEVMEKGTEEQKIAAQAIIDQLSQ